MGSTFAFAVLTLYSGYHWFTTRNEHLKEIALADISWCIYYVGFCIITVQGGSSVTRTVKNNYFKFINIIEINSMKISFQSYREKRFLP